MKRDIRIYTDKEELSRSAGELIISLAEKVLRDKDWFSLVLSGGKTPVELYRFLGGAISSSRIDLNRLFIFWGDERNVPMEHPESNYRMAWEALLSKLPIPAGNIFRIPTEKGKVEEVALSYDLMLKRFFNEKSLEKRPEGKTPALPEFDLILLGIGKDGHTASLFPGNPLMKDRGVWVMATQAPENYMIRNRITLTLPAINNARWIIFLASGEEKREVLEKVFIKKALSQKRNKPEKKLEKKHEPLYPASLIRPREKLFLFTDLNL
ncbi:MAG: 6-phosphogluconolactonase [Spirochaetota bacterium]